MITFFRSFINSKLGVGITLAFVMLIALAFAGGDILNFGGLGGTSAGTKVASAGDRTITASTLDFFARKGLERVREQDPKQNLRTMVAEGGLDRVLDSLLDNAAISEFGKKIGVIAGDRLVGSELAKSPAFRGNTGNFDEATYRSAIAQQGFTDIVYRQLIADDLVARQFQRTASLGAKAPQEAVLRYSALLTDTREGAIAMIPSAAFAPDGEPSSADLAAFYAAHKVAYMQPERRRIRYVLFGEQALKNVPAPTDTEIAARYNADKAKYAPSETRKLAQVVVPGEAVGKAIIADLAAGKSLDEAARSRKLASATLAPLTRDGYALQSSSSVADAVFTAAEGKTVGPIKGGLGWYIVRIESIQRNPGKTLDQARSEISEALTGAKRRSALIDFSSRIEDELDKGGALSDVAKELGVQVQTTEPLTADGKVFGKPEQTLLPEVARIAQTAFLMEQEGQPQLAEAVPGKTFIVFDVTELQMAAPAPIDTIRAQVITDFKLDKGARLAREAAQKIEAAGKKGTDLGTAIASLGVAVPPVDRINMKRQDLARFGQTPPPPVALMFSMAKGSVKLLPAPQNRGFYVIALKNITPGAIDPKDPRLAGAVSELAQLNGLEFSEQLMRAIRAETGAKIDKAAVAALGKQLSGAN